MTVDEALAQGAAAVQEMERKLSNARRMLIAAAISSPSDLVITDSALMSADFYEWTATRDDANACLRLRVKPKQR